MLYNLKIKYQSVILGNKLPDHQASITELYHWNESNLKMKEAALGYVHFRHIFYLHMTTQADYKTLIFLPKYTTGWSRMVDVEEM